MTDTYDDLDDFDRVWYQDDRLDLGQEVQIDLDPDQRPVFDDDPVADHRHAGAGGPTEFNGFDEFGDEDDVDALDGYDPLRSDRVSRRRTTTLLTASTVTIGVGLALVGVVLTLVILMGRLVTTRQLFFIAHSIFGIVIVHAFGGGIGTLCTTRDSRLKERVRKLSTVSMAAVAWLAAVTGTWFVYAGYRADAPPGADLRLYPRQYLLRTPGLRFWETFAMDWKMHVGWMTPFLATAVAFVALRYGRRVAADLQVRKMLTNLFVIAFAAAVVAAVLGALVNTVAPNDFMHRAYHP